MVRVKDIPKILLAVFIGVWLFMSAMPDKIQGFPAWAFYCLFGLSILMGWLAATGISSLATTRLFILILQRLQALARNRTRQSIPF